MKALRLIGYLISKAFWFIRYQGLENIPDTGGFLIAANHQTYVDPVWICLPMGQRLRFMAFDPAFEWRFIGPFIRYLGAFPVGTPVAGMLKATKESLNALKSGSVLTVFPEGGREFADGKFLPFRSGAVRIAMRAGVPILPVTIRGGNRIWPRPQKYPRLFRRVEIIYHPVLQVNENSDPQTDIAVLTKALKEIIASEYRR